MFSLRSPTGFEASAMGTQNTEGRWRQRSAQTRPLPEDSGCHNLHTLPNAQHMSRLQKALGRRALSASQWACCQHVSNTFNNDKVVHQHFFFLLTPLFKNQTTKSNPSSMAPIPLHCLTCSSAPSRLLGVASAKEASGWEVGSLCWYGTPNTAFRVEALDPCFPFSDRSTHLLCAQVRWDRGSSGCYISKRDTFSFSILM